MITQEELDEAIFDITGRPSWRIVGEFLLKEAYAARDRCGDDIIWESVLMERGFSKGLNFVLNLREMTERAQAEENAEL